MRGLGQHQSSLSWKARGWWTDGPKTFLAEKKIPTLSDLYVNITSEQGESRDVVG